MRDWSGPTVYRMADQVQGQIRRATDFLVRHGYTVTPPAPLP